MNDLAKAVRPVVLPGEEITVRVIQEGKEAAQAVGYLEDGTMVVVENGARHIGSELSVAVMRVLQTVGGRMIFGHPKGKVTDSARPFVPPSLFARCVQIARAEGTAVAGLPLADTVRRADEAGVAIEEVSREGLWSAQTPQAFRRDILERARVAVADRSFGDDAAAVRAAGLPVRTVLGERRNLKITTMEDLGAARELAAKGLVGMPALQIR